MTTQVLEDHARPAGSALEVELRQTEGEPQIFDVVDDVGGGVLRQVRLAAPLRGARTDSFRGQELVEEILDLLFPIIDSQKSPFDWPVPRTSTSSTGWLRRRSWSRERPAASLTTESPGPPAK